MASCKVRNNRENGWYCRQWLTVKGGKIIDIQMAGNAYGDACRHYTKARYSNISSACKLDYNGAAQSAAYYETPKPNSRNAITGPSTTTAIRTYKCALQKTAIGFAFECAEGTSRPEPELTEVLTGDWEKFHTKPHG